MKITKDSSGIHIYFNKNCFAHSINEWRQPAHICAWYTATVINIEFERDVAFPGAELVFILFGIGLRIRYNGDMESTEEGRKIKKIIDKASKNKGS